MPTASTTKNRTSVFNSPGRDNRKEDPLAARQHPVGGLAAQADDGAEEVLTQCPFCGGTIVRCEIQDSGGKRAFSLCCDMPQELIDNYEVLRNLPEHLQQVAIKAKKAEYAAMAKKSAENARRFREAVEHWNAKHGHLTKDAQDGIPFDHEGATSPKLQNLPKET